MLRSALSKASGSSLLPRSSLGRAARHTLAFALVLLLTGLSAAGCSRQGEGERCDLAANGDDDCDEGLICVSKVGNVDRCCPPDGADVGDSRCSVANAPPGGSTGGVSSGGTSSGGSSTAGASSGGANASGGTSGGNTGGTSPSTGGTNGGETSGAGAGGDSAGAGGDSAGSGGQTDAAAGSSGAAG